MRIVWPCRSRTPSSAKSAACRATASGVLSRRSLGAGPSRPAMGGSCFPTHRPWPLWSPGKGGAQAHANRLKALSRTPRRPPRAAAPQDRWSRCCHSRSRSDRRSPSDPEGGSRRNATGSQAGRARSRVRGKLAHSDISGDAEYWATLPTIMVYATPHRRPRGLSHPLPSVVRPRTRSVLTKRCRCYQPCENHFKCPSKGERCALSSLS
jgi:hypothetical protein